MKATLAIEMPATCRDCALCTGFYPMGGGGAETMRCCGLPGSGGYRAFGPSDINALTGRLDDCPLEPADAEGAR